MSSPTPTGPPPGTAPRCYRHPDRETWIRCQRCERPICPDCMRPASVGFQCPECVAEGQRTQRQPRTRAGGLIPDSPGRITIGLIVVNVAVWLLVLATGGTGGPGEAPSRIFTDGVMLGSDVCFRDAGCLTGVDGGGYWRLLTAAFLHVQVLHILFNMYALFVLGPQLERALGYVRFLALYLTSAIAGSVVVLWFTDPTTPTLGASGAVYGLFGATFVLARAYGGDITSIAIVLALNLFITFTIPNISWQGHLGGLAAGLLVGVVFAYAPRAQRTLYQSLAFGGIWLAMVAAVVAHAA